MGMMPELILWGRRPHYNRGFKGKSTITYTKSGGFQGDVVKSWMDLFFRSVYQREDQSFIQSILENRAPDVSGWDGMMAVDVVRAGNESIRTGNIVWLNGKQGKG